MTESLEAQREALRQAMAVLEAQRPLLGDAVVDAALGSMCRQLADLEAQGAPVPERKLVTVMFADVSGFTALSESLDMEAMADLMNALWERLDAAIMGAGGRIDKHIGDAVMAVWGADAACEDDPEQALRAALAMQGELARFNEQPGMGIPGSDSAGRAIRLQMRFGINTGPAVLGEVGSTHEFTAMGGTVNVAARLEQAAPVGGILISYDTYRHVRGIFAVQSQEPLLIKGKQEPVPTFLVLRAMPRAFRPETRGVEGVETRMVGREGELADLQAAFLAVVEKSERQLVAIVGEAGIGKSRLLHEFKGWCEAQPQRFCSFRGRADPRMQHVPYALLRDVLAFQFGILDSDPPPLAGEKLERGVLRMMRADADSMVKAHFIGALIGMDFSASLYLRGILQDRQQIHDRALHYLSQFFMAVTALNPAVILLEDLHWADESSLEAFQELIRRMEGRPLLVVGTARPAFFERVSPPQPGGIAYRQVNLTPLSAGESRQLVEEILRKAGAVPEALRDLVVQNAEGNPFYVEELVKMLIEDGVIQPGVVSWRIDPERLGGVRIPATLTALLQARFDRLPAGERQVLARAAVIGSSFWDGAVAFLDEAGSEALAETRTVLAALQAREMVFARQHSMFEQAQEFVFKHALLRETIYGRLLKRERQLYHARAAEWLRANSGAREGELAGVIGEHLAQAGQVAEAVTYLRRAGDRAASQYANAMALTWYGRALEWAAPRSETDPLAVVEIQAACSRVLTLMNRHAEALERCETAWTLLDCSPNVPEGGRRRAELCYLRAQVHERRSEYEPALAWIEKGLAYLEGDGPVPERARLAYLAGWIDMRRGMALAAFEGLTRALAIARAVALRPVEADILRTLGAVSWQLNDLEQTLAFSEQALLVYRELGDRYGESRVLNNLGVCHVYNSCYDAAQQCYERALEIYQELGNGVGAAGVFNNLGLTALDCGDLQRADSCFCQALALRQGASDRWGEALTLYNLGQTCMAGGEYDRAREHLERALEIRRQIGDRGGQGGCLVWLGFLAFVAGDDSRAESLLQPGVQIAREAGIRDDQGMALVHLGQLRVRQGRLEEAAVFLEEALALGEQKAYPTLQLRIRAGRAELFLAQGRVDLALAEIEPVLGPLRERVRRYIGGPFVIYWIGYQVLQAAGDPRAAPLLAEAYERLQAWAAPLDGAQRRRFLEGIAVNRAIAQAFER